MHECHSKFPQKNVCASEYKMLRAVSLTSTVKCVNTHKELPKLRSLWKNAAKVKENRIPINEKRGFWSQEYGTKKPEKILLGWDGRK